MKHTKLLFPILLIVMIFTCNLSAQIKLLKVDSIKCINQDYDFKPVFVENWINNDILQIKTTSLINCIGVNSPRVKLRGPLLNLEFNDFMIENKTEIRVEADCSCVYQIIWQISGLNKKNKYIVLLNGLISSDYKKSCLDSLLTNYDIDKIYHFQLRNVIDKKGQKQGYHLSQIDNQKVRQEYLNGILLKTN